MRVEIPYTCLPQTEFCHLIRMLKQKPVSTYYVMFSKQHKPRHSNKKKCRHVFVKKKKNADTRTSDTQLITHRAGGRNVIEILSVTHSLTHSRVPTSTTPLEASYQSLFFRLLAHFFQ